MGKQASKQVGALGHVPPPPLDFQLFIFFLVRAAQTMNSTRDTRLPTEKKYTGL